jgi:hypothetical protein
VEINVQIFNLLQLLYFTVLVQRLEVSKGLRYIGPVPNGIKLSCGHLPTPLVGGQTSRVYSSNTGQYMYSACI